MFGSGEYGDGPGPTPGPRAGQGGSDGGTRIGSLWAPFALTAFLLQGCTLVGGPSRPPPSPAPGAAPSAWTETGVASWYGEPFHGRTTASGEVYDMNRLTCAHRTLPFGTRLHVRNLENGRTVVVRVNDRGPFVNDRIVDLSRRAAQELELIGPGTARVRITVVGAPAPATPRASTSERP